MIASVGGGLVQLPVEKLGTVYGGRRTTVDPDRAKAYAAATNDLHSAYLSGVCAPPVFGAVATWDDLTHAVREMVPAHARPALIHGEQDMHFHRPLVPGHDIVTSAQLHSLRGGPSVTSLTVRLTSVDVSVEIRGQPLLDQYVTLLVRGPVDGGTAGPEKPSHAFPDSGLSDPAATATLHVDRDQPLRYAEASGDRMPVHLDEGHAKRMGLPGVIVQGLCTLAMAGRVLVQQVGGGDPCRLRRLSARFCGPVLPDDDIELRAYRATTGFHFEADSHRGQAVLAHGLIEVE